jgi:O-antigen/teichoic acid export membrane protein
MSRLKHYSRSLISSYGVLGANAAYSLISVPLALKYLSKPEFGLWVLTVQIGNYISLLDLGMQGSVARLLIDHKDDRSTRRYGAAIKTALLVGSAQAVIALVIGFALLPFLVSWLPEHDRAALAHSFMLLMGGQVILTAATFLTRVFIQVLYAWQRMDISNYIQIAQLGSGFCALWGCFAFGCGVYSYLAGALVSCVFGVLLHAMACRALGFWPQAGEWGQASWAGFREMFNYGADLFLIALGGQLVTSSQSVLLAHQMGLETAALWAVMTKAFTLVSQIVWRVMYSAMPALAEMQVRKEESRMWGRYRSLFVGVNVLGGISAVLFAACNGVFVSVWTKGRFSWPQVDNILLGAWMVVSVQQGCHNGLVANLKKVGALKYVFLAEGIVFVVVALAVIPSWGVTGMMGCSVSGTLLFTWVGGNWRVAQLLGGWQPLIWDWQKPMLLTLAAMVPCWLLSEWMLHGAVGWVKLLLSGGLLAVSGAAAAFSYALPADVIAEAVKQLPASIRTPTGLLLKYARGR